MIENFLIEERVVIEHEIVTEEDDSSGTEGNGEDEFGIFGFLEEVLLLDKIKKHVIIIGMIWERSRRKVERGNGLLFFG